MKHTPGPWKVGTGNGCRIWAENGTRFICNAKGTDHRVLESKHNACLIAAAPDMYEKLEFIEGWLCHNTRFKEFKEIVEWGKETGRILAKARNE